MKYYIIIYAVLLAALSSCEKVINVDLKKAEPKIVIEGIVDNSGNPAKVTIAKSVFFSNDNNFPVISGALVKITDNTGAVFLLTETAAGTYTNALLTGIPGRTYTMSVLAEGKSYTAVCKMPLPVNLDSVFQDKIIITNPVIFANAVFDDPVGFGNNYQFTESINGRRNKTLFIMNDIFQDGGTINTELIDEDAKLKVQDTVQIEMRCIDKPVFHYLRGIEDLTNGATVPANPDSNISNEALGYFSAHTSQKKTIIIK